MLQNGAKKVYAVDVGYGQLAWKLRTDPRVINLERTNIRYATKEQIPDPIDFISVDVIFYFVETGFACSQALYEGWRPSGLLDQPQFEAGREKGWEKGRGTGSGRSYGSDQVGMRDDS